MPSLELKGKLTVPEVSIVVPIYNVEPFLRRCIDSILSQTYPDFQLILVDDGSPDRCGQICDEYAEKDSRIHVIHRENGGLSTARNSGIDWVFDGHYTEWITFIDSDDWVTPNYLEELLSVAQLYQVNIAVGSSQHAHEGEVFTECAYDEVVKYTPEEFWVKDKDLATVAWAKLYKTSLFDSIRYPKGKLHEDEFTTHLLLFSQESIAVTDARLYNYYFTPNSIMRSKWTIKKLDALEAVEDQMLFFWKSGYKKAYKVSEKRFIQAINYTVDQINMSEHPRDNISLMYKQIDSFLKQRYQFPIPSKIYVFFLKNKMEANNYLLFLDRKKDH